VGKPKSEDFAWQGPQQAGQPWDEWKPEQHEAARRLIERLDGAKTYQSSGRMAGHKFAPDFEAVAVRGGLDPSEALTLARYRMANKGLGPVPQGPKTEEDTPEQVAKRGAEFREAKPEQRGAMMEDDKARSYLSHDRFYDSLTGKARPKHAEKPPQGEGITPEKIQAAREVLAKRSKRNV
jgi:hypothetical protein